MRLTKEAIEEFQALYEQECGEPISFEEAEVRANEIVNLYVMLLEQLPVEQGATLPDDLPARERL